MIQIDIPMPKCCDECFALDEYGDYPFCRITQDQRGYNFRTREQRMPSCPMKEQEAVEPTPTYYVRTLDNRYYSQIWECGNCGENLPGARFDTKYCPNCGRKVNWDAITTASDA